MNLIVNTRYNERRLTIFTSNYRGHSRRHRSQLAAVLASATGCVRGCTRCASSSMLDGADYREMPANGGVDDSGHDVEAAEEGPLPSPRAVRPPGARAAARAAFATAAPI